MKRMAMTFLNEWVTSSKRKPLVIRGARQVGKTWLVRDLASSRGLELIEVNLEKNPHLFSLFSSNDPHSIVRNLASTFEKSIEPERSLLFLDEIQAAPELLAKLRWFAEDMPELAVIAAGSLLDFVLKKHSMSMPVGRISYMYLEPLSFEEFLMAGGYERLVDYIKTYLWGGEIPGALHEKLMILFKEYIIVGGMPEAVADWMEHHSFNEISRIHQDLITTYRTDFSKYSGRVPVERLDDVLMAVPDRLSHKFVYSKINPSASSQSIKQALDLLATANVCHRVRGCAANGIPLAAEIQEKMNKVILLDVGLCSALLKLSIDQLANIRELDLINSGGIAEQVVGQLLRTTTPFFIEPALYYWHREEPGSDAEVDYVIQHQNKVIPVEVKAGKTGTLKSLHVFMGLKEYRIAVRINSDIPRLTEVKVQGIQDNPINYRLLSLPFYMLGEIHRLLPIA